MHNSVTTLTRDQWASVIAKVSSMDKSDMYLFILRSLANSQQISYYSIHAFNGELTAELDHEGQASNTYIGQITKVIQNIINDDTMNADGSSWYIWHTTDKAWVISWKNLIELRKGFDLN